MKSLTEFFFQKLAKGIDSQKALTAEGKTPEEIQQSLGETFKLEGDKLKYFFNSLGIASENMEKLARIQVVSLNEGEIVPPNAVKIEEQYYIPNFYTAAPTQDPNKTVKDTRRNKGKRTDRPRSSPWGISPEEQAAKIAAKKKTQQKS